MNEETLTVELGERSYPIVIGSGLLAGGFDLEAYLPGDHCLVVTNETVGRIYTDSLRRCLGDARARWLAVPDGEAFKTMATFQAVIDDLVAARAGRDSAVIALGGGVIGDIAGFAAACYMRGVAFVQVPTTLLAQVDSSVGGKTGVNHPGGKNLVGAFYQPRLVLIDTDTLSTLPDRELKAGLAEVIKYGAILDREFLVWLEANIGALLDRDPAALGHAIRRSCEIKAQIVAQDERESGRRALLNFGHTFGHAIENTLGYGEWLHGEAVAAGMLMAATMSGLDASEFTRLEALLAAAGLPTSPPRVGAATLREAMRMDKKTVANRVRFVLLRRLGDAFVSTDYSEEMLARALRGSDG